MVIGELVDGGARTQDSGCSQKKNLPKGFFCGAFLGFLRVGRSRPVPAGLGILRVTVTDCMGRVICTPYRLSDYVM